MLKLTVHVGIKYNTPALFEFDDIHMALDFMLYAQDHFVHDPDEEPMIFLTAERKEVESNGNSEEDEIDCFKGSDN